MLVSIGARRLFVEKLGTGSPVVVIEVGSTMPGTADPGWRLIADRLAKEQQVFLYDRANLGKSDPAPLPRSLTDFSEDLSQVLQESAVPPPYLLVGGSFGGMIVLHYASLHPREVCGVVLVDSTHPEANLQTLKMLPPERPNELKALAAFRRQAWLEQYTPLETFEKERLEAATSLEQARAWNLGDIPLVVLTAGIDEWEEGFPGDIAEKYESLWLDLQKQMAALSSRSIHRVVEDSDHIIHVRKPEAVMEAIRTAIHLGRR